ncbi:MAG: IS6 family transposase [Thaumarchaeota archaeon]|nr:IS6 family transposase [Nitrososphaerota archaeon]MCL5317370.1 IS6 family transposase [Nitrososphaerota archaeon]
MTCKYCGSEQVVKNGKVAGKQVFKCKECGHRFYANEQFTKMRVPKHVIVAGLNLYFDGLSVRKAKTQLENILGEKVDSASIWRWVNKYSNLVNKYVSTLEPELSGKWHEDETMIKADGRNVWLWEMIDEDTKFVVASHISGTRTLEDTVAIFRKGLETAKQRPRAIFVDGSHVYQPAFNKVFYSRYKVQRVELVQRVGIRARQTNNVIERMHGTVKDRLKPMRGLQNERTAQTLLTGFLINYNYVRKHQTIGMTPAQAAGVGINNGWSELIEKSTVQDAKPKAEAQAQTVAPIPMVR